MHRCVIGSFWQNAPIGHDALRSKTNFLQSGGFDGSFFVSFTFFYLIIIVNKIKVFQKGHFGKMTQIGQGSLWWKLNFFTFCHIRANLRALNGQGHYHMHSDLFSEEDTYNPFGFSFIVLFLPFMGHSCKC